MENVTEVPKWFLPLNSGITQEQMKIQVLNLKNLKTQIPIRYLTLNSNENICVVIKQNIKMVTLFQLLVLVIFFLLLKE
jgi:hypothetical protein